MLLSVPTMDTAVAQMDREKMRKRMNPKDPTVASIYLAFFSFTASLWGHDWSAFLTSVFALRMLASVQLAVFVQNHESVEGISAHSVALYAMSHAFRLSSTLWLQGYLPSDSIADNFLCQFMDIVSLGCTIYVLYHIFFGTAKSTHLKEKDTMSFGITFIFCCVLAVLLHGDLDDKPVFDTFFFVGLYTNCFALAPQLWMMRKDGFARQYLTWNYVCPVLGSGLVAMLFWWRAYEELVPFSCIESEEAAGKADTSWKCVNFVGYATLAVHIIQCSLVLLVAFKNAPIVFRINTDEGEFSVHLTIPTVPAPGGPATQVAV